ncbi:hypothetical protein [Mucilaginibacter xinganensis]|uniref:Transcriptional regulator n=1 Tax=Mucilaginibacter xinganensis TaxID=1234841 RepID=A0A223NTU8_9SPHI|nr:hypothetical protein [Mucilaginibacter xinganensis]ASU33068.1 transcriptional regulator [Mucilaginibacter xinganensis]
MSFLSEDFTDNDVQLSKFARAMALPVRVFILRMIIESGNSISKKAFYDNSYNSRTIDKHILELKSLGIIKTNTVKTGIIYCIDQNLFNQMSNRFHLFFDATKSLSNSR